MNPVVGELIVRSLGGHIEIEQSHTGLCVGSFLCIRVHLDVTKALRRVLQYERLPMFCYIYGLLNHTEKNYGVRATLGEVDPRPYGSWLRATLEGPNLQGWR
ncbi:unnamed protein product [Prunus brigantina]